MTDREEKIKAAINWEQGVEQFGEDEEMFEMMIGKFEPMSFNEGLKKLHDQAVSKDWTEFRRTAHTLKGASAYIAATSVQEISLQLQLICDKFFKQIEEKTLPPGGQEKFEQEVIEMLLYFYHEAKYLKERIAQITKQPCDLSEVEFYEFDIKTKYPQKSHPACCGGCTIF
mmetsp:Transcript_51819/g.59520  ORF Transcript_51819/g.59520 Transcript_51819/m.59520 type:complete len:171 (+) Transcript_51819:58-570(+)